MALTHVHEYEGSVQVVENHNHRFAGVTGEVIVDGTSHRHRLAGRTDFYEDHFHMQNRLTSLAISVGGGRHIHFIANGLTTIADGHQHPYRVATLINDPIGE